MRVGSGAYRVDGEDYEGVGNLRNKSSVNLVLIVGGLPLSDGHRCFLRIANHTADSSESAFLFKKPQKRTGKTNCNLIITIFAIVYSLSLSLHEM